MIPRQASGDGELLLCLALVALLAFCLVALGAKQQKERPSMDRAQEAADCYRMASALLEAESDNEAALREAADYLLALGDALLDADEQLRSAE